MPGTFESLMDPDVFLRMLRFAGKHDARGFLEVVDVPVLVIAADFCSWLPPAASRHSSRLAKGLSGGPPTLVT